jgi:hypothetical protein
MVGGKKVVELCRDDDPGAVVDHHQADEDQQTSDRYPVAEDKVTDPEVR